MKAKQGFVLVVCSMILAGEVACFPSGIRAKSSFSQDDAVALADYSWKTILKKIPNFLFPILRKILLGIANSEHPMKILMSILENEKPLKKKKKNKKKKNKNKKNNKKENEESNEEEPESEEYSGSGEPEKQE